MPDLFAITTLDGETAPSTSVGRAPGYCPAPLHHVPGRLHRLPDGGLFEQRYRGPSYTLGLLSTGTDQPLRAGIRFNRRAVILNYSYAGKARLFRQGKHLLTIAGHHLQASAVAYGEYEIELAAPRTSILFAAMDDAWIRGMGDTLPQGRDLLQGMASGLFVQDTLPPIWARPDELSPLLEKLHACDVAIESLRQGKLENYLHKIWLGYERVLALEHALPLNIRSHVLSCITDHAASHTERIADHFENKVRNLSRSFQRSFGITLHEYILQHRLWKAWQLIHGKHLKVKDASEIVGYEYLPSFIRAYKTHFGKNPGDDRRDYMEIR